MKHAIIALGTLARQQGEHSERWADVRTLVAAEALSTPDCVRMNLPLIQLRHGEDERFALMHYTKAIRNLVPRIGTSEVSIDVVLLACVIFVCFELLRGKQAESLTNV